MIWEVVKGSVTRVPNKTERSKQLNIHATLLKKTTTTKTSDSMTNVLFSIILSVSKGMHCFVINVSIFMVAPPPPLPPKRLPLPFAICFFVLW